MKPFTLDVQYLDHQFVSLDISSLGHTLAFGMYRSTLMDQIQAHQFDDDRLRVTYDRLLNGETKSGISLF